VEQASIRPVVWGRAVTLSAMTVHTAIVLELCPWAVQSIDKLRRAFLWKGTDSISGGHCLVEWTKCCRPQELGGLGIPDLKLTGVVLRLRREWLRRTDDSRPWSTLPGPSDELFLAMFCASVSVQVGDGRRALFWTNNWLNGSSIELIAPCPFNVVPAKSGKQERWRRHCTTPGLGILWGHSRCRLFWSICPSGSWFSTTM
jgi:hypothetical protein